MESRHSKRKYLCSSEYAGIWAYQGAVGVETDVLEKYDFDLTTVKSLEDMEPLFEKIKADNPDIYPIVNCGPAELLNNYQNTLGFEELAGSKILGALVYGDDEMKVVNQFELPQVQDFFQMMYEWNQKGYFRSDSATVTDENMDIQAGKSVSKLTSTYKPGVETDTKAKTGKELYVSADRNSPSVHIQYYSGTYCGEQDFKESGASDDVPEQSKYRSRTL